MAYTLSTCARAQCISSQILIKVGVSVSPRHNSHWVMTNLKLTFDPNRELRGRHLVAWIQYDTFVTLVCFHSLSIFLPSPVLRAIFPPTCIIKRLQLLSFDMFVCLLLFFQSDRTTFVKFYLTDLSLCRWWCYHHWAGWRHIQEHIYMCMSLSSWYISASTHSAPHTHQYLKNKNIIWCFKR